MTHIGVIMNSDNSASNVHVACDFHEVGHRENWNLDTETENG